jgi:hypothetical protein
LRSIFMGMANLQYSIDWIIALSICDLAAVRSSYGIIEKYRSIDCRYRHPDRFCQSKPFNNSISQTSVNYTKEIS